MKRYRKADRLHAFKSVASQLEWKCFEDDPVSTISWLRDFRLFKTGNRKGISPLIITRVDEFEFTAAFDYQYTVSTNNSSTTYRQTVYARYSKALALPHFMMVPEKWYHRIGVMMGMQDINFESYPEFSRNYLLRGADEDYIRHHFDHPEMIRFFGTNAFYSLEGMNYLMVLYVHNVVLPLEQIAQLINIGNRLHNYLADKTPVIQLPPDVTDPAPGA